MVSYPVTFPNTLTVNSLKITPKNAVARSISKFTFVEQIYNFSGEAWKIEGSLPLMPLREVAEEYISFVLKLKGRYGTFLFQLPDNVAAPSGTWAGTPVVDGAGQTGNELDIKGLTPSTTSIIKRGDFFNLGTGSSTRLYKVLDNANSDGAGKATVTIWPSLRASPADEATIVFEDVKLLLRLDEDIPTDIDENKHYRISFSATEALNGS